MTQRASRSADHPAGPARLPRLGLRTSNARSSATSHAESARRTARGQALAVEKRAKILDRLRALPDGEHKARQAARRIDLVRAYGGYREFPKFAMIARYAHYRRALGAEAERLVRAGALSRPDDLYFLSLAEIGDLLRGDPVDEALIATRRRGQRTNVRLSKGKSTRRSPEPEHT